MNKRAIKMLVLSSVIAGALLLNVNAVNAEEIKWRARTVEEIRESIEISADKNIYTIQSGDTLFNISLAVDISVDRLKEINQQVIDVSLIYVGNKLVFDDKNVTVLDRDGVIIYDGAISTTNSTDTKAPYEKPVSAISVSNSIDTDVISKDKPSLETTCVTPTVPEEPTTPETPTVPVIPTLPEIPIAPGTSASVDILAVPSGIEIDSVAYWSWIFSQGYTGAISLENGLVAAYKITYS